MQVKEEKEITFPSLHLKMILTVANVFTNHSNGNIQNERLIQ